MKFAIVTLNIFLVCFLAYSALERFSKAGRSSASVVSVARRGGSKNVKTGAAKTLKAQKAETKAVAGGDVAVQAAVVTAGNIFDTARCENAQVMGRTNTRASEKKVELTLVGMVVAGDRRGAIILQKDKNLNSMQNQQTLMRPGMPPAPPGTAGTAGATAEKEIVYKQFVRVGETLANGYTLTSVSRTGATLEKGSDKLELVMTEASKNMPSQSTARTNTAAMPGSPFQNMTEEQRREFRENMERNRAERRAARERENGGSGGSGGGSAPSNGANRVDGNNNDTLSDSSRGGSSGGGGSSRPSRSSSGGRSR